MTFREWERAGRSVSRAGHWLGRVKRDPSEGGAFTQRDEPSDLEERRVAADAAAWRESVGKKAA